MTISISTGHPARKQFVSGTNGPCLLTWGLSEEREGGIVPKNYLCVTKENLLQAEKLIPSQAISGGYPAVCNLLMILSEALVQEVSLTPKLRDFLADALREMSEGGDPMGAFKIKRKRGEKDTRGAVERNVMLAANVAKLLGEKCNGMSVEKAIVKIAEKACVPEETVKAAWRDYRNSVELNEWGAFLTFAKVKKRQE